MRAPAIEGIESKLISPFLDEDAGEGVEAYVIDTLELYIFHFFICMKHSTTVEFTRDTMNSRPDVQVKNSIPSITIQIVPTAMDTALTLRVSLPRAAAAAAAARGNVAITSSSLIKLHSNNCWTIVRIGQKSNGHWSQGSK